MDYSVRRYEDSDEQGVLDLLRLTLPSPHWDTPALWRWKHFENPFGRSIITVAEAEDGRIVGLTGWMKWRLRLGDQVLTAGRPVDTATHPEFRRRGVFSRFTKLAEQIAREEGLDLSISTPNEASCPGFLKYGWELADTTGKQLRVIQPLRAVLNAVGARLSIVGDEWVPKDEGFESIENLLEAPGLERLIGSQRPGSETLRTEKDLAYLKWRYADSPFGGYHAVTSLAENNVEAAAIVRAGSLRGMRAMLILELFTNKPDAVGSLIHKLSRSGADVLRAYFLEGCGDWVHLDGMKFRPDPSKTQILISKSFDADLPDSKIEFSLGDLEAL